MVWRLWGYFLLWVMVAGCSFSAASVADDDGMAATVGLDDCISERGQRLLTFCASTEAAKLAEYQVGLQRSVGAGERVEDLVALPVDGAPLRGDRDAPITIHLFSDMACVDCREVYRRLVELVDESDKEVRLVFRHAPGSSDGERAARAVVSAGEQGKFWEFSDALHRGEELSPASRWAEIAGEAGLDAERWADDRWSPIVSAILEGDLLHGEARGVVEAPTFFVNGQRMVGAVAVEEIQGVLREERRVVRAMEEAGLQGADISWRRILQNYRDVHWEDVRQARQEMESGLTVEFVPVDGAPQTGALEEDSLVTVVFFADFQCPYSAEAAQAWTTLLQEFSQSGLRLVYRHFLPLDVEEDHIVEAATVADEYGKFWEFFERVYLRHAGRDTESIRGTVVELTGVEWEAPQQVATTADRELGEGLGVRGTPTVFINGIKLEGALTAHDLAPLIADQIELARSVRELTGNQGDDLYRDLVEANRGD